MPDENSSPASESGAPDLEDETPASAAPDDGKSASKPEDELGAISLPKEAAGGDANGAAAASGAKRILGLKPLEFASLAGLGLIIVGLLLIFSSSLSKHIPMGAGTGASRSPDLPARGKLITLAAADSHWRAPRSGERVSPNQALIPEIILRLGKPGGKATGTGFVKVIIRDDQGKIRGDVAQFEVKTGQFTTTSSDEARMIGTEGLERTLDLSAYGVEGGRVWTAEIFEGTAYGGTDWNLLAHFELSGKRGPDEESQ